MFGRNIIGTARCTNGGNPAPGTTGWKIHTGGEYRVLRCWEAKADGTVWLTILADDGQSGNYEAWRFDWHRTEATAAAAKEAAHG